LHNNPVYRELLRDGVRVAADRRVKLPEPTMPDGLNAAAARAKIDGIPARHVPVEELLRKSVVAPLVFEFREVEAADPRAPVHGVDVWFAAYGDLEPLGREKFLDEIFSENRRDVTLHVLSPAELAERQICLTAAAEQHERYVHSVLPVMDRVQLSVTSRSFRSRTTQSLVFAAALDPRFNTDQAFSNCWRPLTLDAAGGKELGTPLPYQGAASYLKVTRLAEPRGALLVEYHLLFVEPKAWFGGANLLRSKLPILIQSQVRTFRRQLSQAAAD
jgi:hypothetical protein